MSLFDGRTDTEKELDSYRKSHPTNERQSPFDKYKNTENIQSNTQSDRYNYGNENYNDFYDSTSQNTNGYFSTDISTKDTVKNGSNQKVRKKGRISIPRFILFAVGAVVIFICLFFIFADDWLAQSVINNIGAVLMCSIFVIADFIMLCVGIIKPINDKARCNVSLEAEVIDIKSRFSSDSDGNGSWVYAPVYRYYYQGQEYKISSDMYSSSVDGVGTKQEICINPYNPKDFIEPKRLRSLSVLLLIMGVMFAGMGLFVMILFILIA